MSRELEDGPIPLELDMGAFGVLQYYRPDQYPVAWVWKGPFATSWLKD